MFTIRQVLAGATGFLLLVTVATTAYAKDGRNKDRSGSRDDDSRHFTAGPACEVSHEGHLQFVSGRSPFRGGSRGSYGGIFFAGGGTTVPKNQETKRVVSAPTTAPAHPTPAVGGGGSSPAPAPPAPPRGGAPAPTAPPTGAAVPAPPAGVPVGTPVTANPGITLPVVVPIDGPTMPPVGAPVAAPVRTVAVNPEPTSLLLIGTGLAGVFFGRRRARKSRG
jgi:hypothetical protein